MAFFVYYLGEKINKGGAAMVDEKGNISINTENIFPIIKKWLYSDKDIFVRELISNSADAIIKHKRLVGMGEVPEPEGKYEIHVIVDKKNKTLSFSDNGIGMTGEEVKKYINQIAFSGAQDFIEKYKDKADGKDDIIGHFGLGFYSAFMVAEKVEVDTLSYMEDAEPVVWESDGTSEYTMKTGSRTERGTTITLHITKEEKEFLDYANVKKITQKYCGFMAYDIYVEDASKKKDDEINEPVNDTEPLWLKKPSECTDEEYEEFYIKAFNDFRKPLFWIHLNMEYPFRLKGILYFPKLGHEFEPSEGKIKLFYNQVFVAENIKEVIPEFLMLLKGVLDCPDLPLNVSRSFLQNDGYVRKISSHITKKVADKLKKLYKKQRDDYNKYWDDINLFVKYGCMRDEKFYDRVKDYIIYKTINGEYKTLDEFTENLEAGSDEKKTVRYVSSEAKQSQYMEMYKEHGLDAVILDTLLDSSFINFIEMKSDVKFESIDSNISQALKGEGDTDGFDELKEFVKETIGDENLKVDAHPLKSDEIPAVIMADEQSKRMKDMSMMYGAMGINDKFPSNDTLILNTGNPVIKKLAKSSDEKTKGELVRHIYELALLAAGKLEASDLGRFLKRSSGIIEKSLSETPGASDKSEVNSGEDE